MTNHKHFLKATITTLLAMHPALVFADTYNATTGLVSMPVVHVGDTSYHVTMMHQGNLNFQVTMADFATETSDTPDTYNAETGILYMPVVSVGNETYEVTMQHNGDLNFTVISAESTQTFANANSTNLEGAWCGSDGQFVMFYSGNNYYEYIIETDYDDWWDGEKIEICGQEAYYMIPWGAGTYTLGETFVTGTNGYPDRQLNATQISYRETNKFGYELSESQIELHSHLDIFRIEGDNLFMSRRSYASGDEYPTEFYQWHGHEETPSYIRSSHTHDSLPVYW